MEGISGGSHPPGERLPPEMEIARELGVSRGAVRELLRSLADRGVVSIQYGRGTWVQPTSDWNVLDADVLAGLMPTPASVPVLTHYLEVSSDLRDRSSCSRRATSNRDRSLPDGGRNVADE